MEAVFQQTWILIAQDIGLVVGYEDETGCYERRRNSEMQLQV